MTISIEYSMMAGLPVELGVGVSGVAEGLAVGMTVWDGEVSVGVARGVVFTVVIDSWYLWLAVEAGLYNWYMANPATEKVPIIKTAMTREV